MNLESDFKSGGPLVKGGAVLGYGGKLVAVANKVEVKVFPFQIKFPNKLV